MRVRGPSTQDPQIVAFGGSLGTDALELHRTVRRQSGEVAPLVEILERSIYGEDPNLDKDVFDG